MDFPRLDAFPQLHDWFMDHSQGPSDTSNHMHRFVWTICRALNHDDNQAAFRLWMNSLDQFFSQENQPFQVFIDAEQFFSSVEFDFLSVASQICEFGIRTGNGSHLLVLLQMCADRSGLTVFRFLSAWTALNTDQAQLCIDECEKITEPFGCVYTLQGQAYLELGHIDPAIENLKVAVELTPEDTLAQFQLAKAYLATDQADLAWQHLEICDQQMPNHPEIDIMKTIIALNDAVGNRKLNWLQKLIPRLIQHFSLEPQNIHLLNLVFDASVAKRDQASISMVMSLADWEYVKNRPEFLRNIPQILRTFEKLEWKDSANQLLKYVTHGLSA